jgi:hypothetical protein
VGVERRGFPVLPLIQEQSRLLPPTQVDVIVDAPFANRDQSGHLPIEHLHPLIQPFEQPRPWIVARQDATRLQQRPQRVDDGRLERVHSLGQRLNDEVVAIPVDDEGRQQIGLTVHHPIRGGIDGERLPELIREVDAAAHRPGIGNTPAVAEHPEHDLRAIAEQRAAEDAASRAADRDDVARRRVDVADIRAVDPGMSALHPLLAARGNHNGW